MNKKLIVIILFLLVLVAECWVLSFTYDVAYEAGRKAGIDEMVNIIDSIFIERTTQK
jgi:hypothetical protein